MRLPMDEGVVEEAMAGKKMAIYGNVPGESEHILLEIIEFGEGGQTFSGYLWETTEGVLRILTTDSTLLYRFNGLEVVNGLVRVVGECDAGTRVVMCYKEELEPDTWGVRISSHSHYGDASENILKSLKRAGIDAGRIVVVVGGSKADEDYTDGDGVTFLHTSDEKHGCIGLSHHNGSDAFDYWVCLHDTCDILPDFEQRITRIDIGLRPDVITFCEGQPFELGIFSEEFLDEIEIPDIAVARVEEFLKDSASVVVSYGAGCKNMGRRDVYGSGNQRDEFIIPAAGIKKYSAQAAAGGKP